MDKHKKSMIAAGVLMILIASALLLSGCVKKYTRSDIKAYGRKITGHRELTVSETYKEILEDEEGYLDHLWTVTDEESGITFHVLDDYYWALEAVENKLLDDYDSAVFLSLLKDGKIPKGTRLSLKTDDFSGLADAELVCSFQDMEDLEQCYQDLLTVRTALEQAGFPGLKVVYCVQYDNPIRGAVDYEIDEGDTTGEIGSIGEEDLAQMRRNYLACALDYRFEDALKEFGQEEIDALVHAQNTVRIYRPSENGSGTEDGEETLSGAPSEEACFQGVIGSPKYAGISFGTLYELLRIEGRDPKGNAWHFSVTGADGSRLEFSYDFNDLSGFNDARGKLQKGYYYMVDDKKVRMSEYYDNHFAASEIERLTGLRVAEFRPRLSEDRE